MSERREPAAISTSNRKPDEPGQGASPGPESSGESGEHKLIFDPELSQLIHGLNRGSQAAVDAPAPLPAVERGKPPPALIELLTEAAARGAADVLLVADAPPVFRIEGHLERLETDPLTGPAIRELVLPVLDRRRRRDLHDRRFADFAFDVPGVGRFRANVHFERARLGACFRALPAAVPRLERLGLPSSVGRIADLGAGLVLVVGPAGSGKTTTMAALLATVLRSRAIHAITIEEPVEYVHEHHGALVEQVEIPLDCGNFADAIRSALRQSPDVLLVGEMRDAETMAAALTAAETGHLVLASVHAYTAPQAIHRVMDAFPSGQQEQVRRQLAATLAGIVAQRLLPAADGARRVAAAEVLFATDAVRNVIRDGRIHNLGQVITGAEGMISLEASLAAAVRAGRLDRATAERHCYHRDELDQLLR